MISILEGLDEGNTGIFRVLPGRSGTPNETLALSRRLMLRWMRRDREGCSDANRFTLVPKNVGTRRSTKSCHCDREKENSYINHSHRQCEIEGFLKSIEMQREKRGGGWRRRNGERMALFIGSAHSSAIPLTCLSLPTLKGFDNGIGSDGHSFSRLSKLIDPWYIG